jgi:hypothetical protein
MKARIYISPDYGAASLLQALKEVYGPVVLLKNIPEWSRSSLFWKSPGHVWLVGENSRGEKLFCCGAPKDPDILKRCLFHVVREWGGSSDRWELISLKKGFPKVRCWRQWSRRFVHNSREGWG